MSEHRLVDNTLVNTGHGIEGRCTCGWTTGPRFSSLTASVMFRDHVEEASGGTSMPVRVLVMTNPARDIPKDKSYPADAVQCDNCGGHGDGCPCCDGLGWVPPDDPNRRRCAREGCGGPIHPTQLAVYCSVACALADAGSLLASDLPADDKLRDSLRRNFCPDCGTPGLILGPCGGASMNVACGKCGARFNAHGANIAGRRDLRNTFMADRL